MKVLIFGADGFVGRNVDTILRNDSDLEVISASRGDTIDYVVDLLDQGSIRNALVSARPDVVVSCAGVVVNSEEAYKNGEFCRNIFEEVLALGTPYPRVIISGSAAEYGVVDADKPVSENTPLLASNDYGKSKVEEEKIALEYAEKHGIDVVVARIFNPIGPGMGEKFLLTSLLKQIERVGSGEAHTISVSRRDSRRDYVDIRDVAEAIHTLVTAETKSHSAIYNLGSGKSTSNGELIEVLLNHVELAEKPTIIETQDTPEPTYAAQADISRMKTIGWQPKYSLDVTVEDIINAKSHK